VLQIPLIEDLTKGPIPPGSNIIVEFDPASQWYNASLTIAAGWARAGGTVSYGVHVQPPDKVRAQLSRLGLETEELERNDRLRIWDWYTATLGQKSKEKLAKNSLKIADVSIEHAKESMRGPPIPDYLRIWDTNSHFARFNEEKVWIEYELTRVIPTGHLRQSTGIGGIIRGVHSDWVYKQLEAAYDGVVDFRLDSEGEEIINRMRIRSMRNVAFDSRWHDLKLTNNFEVTIEK